MDITLLPRVIGGYILVVFIPGYAFSWALYPRHRDLEFVTRIILSFVLSIVSVMLSVLFADIILGVDVTPANIVIIVTLFTVLASVVWLIQLAYMKSRLKAWVDRKLRGRWVKSPEKQDDSGSVSALWDIGK